MKKFDMNKIKEEVKNEYQGLKLGKYALIALAAVFVLAIVMWIVNPAFLRAHSGFWLFAGICCLGFGITLYVNTLLAKASNLGLFAGIVLAGLGGLWFFTDVVANGMGKVVGAGWWVGLLCGAAIGAALYFVPVLVRKLKK